LLVPELPEVETIVQELAPRLVGRTLRNPQLYSADVLRRVSKRRLLESLDGQRLRAVSRRAKHAVFLLANGLRMVIQPRMTGTLTIHDGALSPDERRYAVLDARVGRKSTLAYRDVRRLGTIWLLNEKQWHTYTARIGPEPLEATFDVTSFALQLRGSKQAIKKVLMDQRRVAGIGNIYANEALFRARIDPRQRRSRPPAPGRAVGADRCDCRKRHHGQRLPNGDRTTRIVPARARGLWPRGKPLLEMWYLARHDARNRRPVHYFLLEMPARRKLT